MGIYASAPFHWSVRRYIISSLGVYYTSVCMCECMCVCSSACFWCWSLSRSWRQQSLPSSTKPRSQYLCFNSTAEAPSYRTLAGLHDPSM